MGLSLWAVLGACLVLFGLPWLLLLQSGAVVGACSIAAGAASLIVAFCEALVGEPDPDDELTDASTDEPRTPASGST